MTSKLSLYLTSGEIYLFLFLLPVLLFILWKTTTSFFLDPREKFHQNILAIRRLVFFLIFFFFVFSICLHVLNWINNSRPASLIVETSDRLADIDRAIFGVNVPFWFQEKNNPWKNIFDTSGPIIIYSYGLLTVFIYFTMMLALIVRFSVFLRFSLSFLVSLIISLPIWFALPALTPMDRYLINVYKAPISATIESEISAYEPNPSLLKFIEDMKPTKPGISQGISTFPSMHVAWGLLVAFFLFELWSPSLIITIPYVFLNSLATVYTLEHYTIDILAGIIIIILSVITANKIVRIIPPKIQITDIIQEDLKKCLGFLKLIRKKSNQ